MSIITVSNRLGDDGREESLSTQGVSPPLESQAAGGPVPLHGGRNKPLSPLWGWCSISLLSMAGWVPPSTPPHRGTPICAAGSPGCRLDAREQCDCLSGCPLKAMLSYCAHAWQRRDRDSLVTATSHITSQLQGSRILTTSTQC